ncbi:Molybdopterin oxidoreductase subunit [Fulvivirga imtechensis AK7]|uniref:Molybdopterin oxidoreductase subunit n=1 Tax=Fulvivirga imtechensis AK7 TaxID=1237149 RepID=L8JRM2_9BACT|nr:c-type cytochrome [Fulvivirga imtechensis]ELR70828.1 Molybdopterin oxidoreductase subunit [Fulvivirga imtechensis AK7]
MTQNRPLTRVFLAFTLAGSLLFTNISRAQEADQQNAAEGTQQGTEQAAPATDGGLPADDASISEGMSLFNSNCKSCHKIEGKLVGPALKDVHKRAPSIDWIVDFVHNSSKVIASGDAYANKIYEEYNKTQMTAFPTLSRQQILNILGYIKQETDALAAAPTTTAVPGDATGQGQGTDTGIPASYMNIIMIALVVVLLLILVVLILITTVLKKYINQKGELEEADKEIVDASFNINAVVKSKPFIFLVTFISAAIVFKVVIHNLYAVGIQQGYAPKQPIAFSHKLHAGQYEIDCNYCHTGVRKSKNANIPSPNICMNCHVAIKTESPEIQKIYAAIENDRPIEWVRIHNLPDLAYFNHAQHVEVGGIECQTCHGEVQEMEVVAQASLLTMGWCIDCHRKTDVNTKGNEYYDNLVELHNAEGKGALKVEDIGGLECSKCHY